MCEQSLFANGKLVRLDEERACDERHLETSFFVAPGMYWFNHNTAFEVMRATDDREYFSASCTIERSYRVEAGERYFMRYDFFASGDCATRLFKHGPNGSLEELTAQEDLPTRESLRP